MVVFGKRSGFLPSIRSLQFFDSRTKKERFRWFRGSNLIPNRDGSVSHSSSSSRFHDQTRERERETIEKRFKSFLARRKFKNLSFCRQKFKLSSRNFLEDPPSIRKGGVRHCREKRRGGGVGDREIEKVTKALESVGVGRRRPSSSVIYVRKTCPPRPAPRRYLSKRSTVHPAVNLFSFKRSREKIAILPPYISKRAFSSQRIKLI